MAVRFSDQAPSTAPVEVPDQEESVYNFDNAKTDPELLSAIKRYAMNVDNKVFKNDDQALEWWKSDRRWKDSNTVSAVKELTYVKGGWGTKWASEQDLQDLAVIRERWERIPGVFSPDRGTGLMERAGALGENVVKGAVDPTVLAGGLAGKAAGAVTGGAVRQGVKTAIKFGAAVAADAAVSAEANKLYQETNVEVSKYRPDLGLQTEVDPWGVLIAGGLGAALSAPGYVGAFNKTANKKIDIDAARKATEAGYEKLKDKNAGGLFVDSKNTSQVLPGAEDFEPEKIASASIKIGDKIYNGSHHGDAMLAAEKSGESFEIQGAGQRAVEGFTTSTGRFVTREEALTIAKAQGQTNTETTGINFHPTKLEASRTEFSKGVPNDKLDKSSLKYTLASQLNIPAAKLEKTHKQLLDYVSGRFVDINNTEDNLALARDVKTKFGDTLFIPDLPVGKTSWSDSLNAAKKGISNTTMDDAAEKIKSLPRDYAGNASEGMFVNLVKSAWYTKYDDLAAKLSADPTNRGLARETQRSFEMWKDLTGRDKMMGSEQGRGLRSRAYTPMTSEKAFGKVLETISKGVNSALDNKSMFDDLDPQEVLKLHAAVKSFADDPLKLDLFVTNISNSQATGKDKLWEAWYNSLLSGPSTSVINTIGNAVMTAMDVSEAGLASTVSKDTPRHLVSGYFKAIPEAWQVFKRTFRTEVPNDPITRMEVGGGNAIGSYVWDSTETGINRWRKAGVGEGGWGGRQVRLPGRLLMAMDDAFKVVHYRANLTDVAAREIKAADPGGLLSKEDFLAELNRRVSMPSPELDKYANDKARLLTLTNQQGSIGRAFTQLVDDIPMGRMVVPFIRTPGNILKYAADMILPFTQRTGTELKAGGEIAARAKARLVMGWSIAAMGMWGAATGNVKGAGPSDPAERNTWMANNLPWSINVGNTQVQWNRLDPVALPFALGAGSVDLLKSINDPERADGFMTTAAKLFADAVLDKTWFQGVENVVGAMTDPERNASSWARGIARTFVPSIVAGSVRAYDPRVTAPQTFMEVFQDRLGFDRKEKLPSKLDAFGNEIQFDVIGTTGNKENSVKDFALRLTVPFRTQKVQDDPVYKEVANLRIGIQPPAKVWNGVELNSDQYYIYSKARGKYIYDGIKFAQESEGWDGLNAGAKRLVIDSIRSEASSVADVILYGVYPDLIKERYSEDKYPLFKKFKEPTQEEVDDRLLSPKANPTIENMKPEKAPENTTKPLTKQENSDIFKPNVTFVKSDKKGFVYDPFLERVELGPDTTEEQALSVLSNSGDKKWKQANVKVKLEDGSVASVPASKISAVLSKRLKDAEELKKRLSNEVQ